MLDQAKAILCFKVGKLLGDHPAQFDAKTVDHFLGQIRMGRAAKDFNVGHPSTKIFTDREVR